MTRQPPSTVPLLALLVAYPLTLGAMVIGLHASTVKLDYPQFKPTPKASTPARVHVSVWSA